MSEHSPRVGSLEYARNLKTYVPKVGDKVRATLGALSFEGTVANSYVNGTLDVLYAGSSFVTCDHTDGWHFEQIVSVPTKFGAVIRRADGEVFVLAEPNAADNRDWFGEGCGWHRAKHATAGGFTVLFDGVDE